MMKKTLLILCFVLGIFNGNAVNATEETKSTTKSIEETVATTSSLATSATTTTTITATKDAAKDKRQVGAKDTQIYPNHRSDTVEDDPEDGQETIYGPKPNQFLIRPISPHQHQQHEEHQQTQLRNYPVTIRPHSQQILEQSQEIQHFAYLQDLTRNHPATKTAAASSQRTAKAQSKKTAAQRAAAHTYSSAQTTTAAAEEAEQRYAYAVQTQVPQPQPHQFQQATPYQITAAPPPPPLPRHQHQQQAPVQPQLQQQYQIIPEEQFLKILEEELQARAYHAEQSRQQQNQLQQQQQQQHHQQLQQRQYHAQSAQSQQDTANKVQQQIAAERSAVAGLGSYRQRVAEEPSDEYIQYIPQHRGGPKYLPEPQQLQQVEPSVAPTPAHFAFYTPPQLKYKMLPNHPLAKSSLEKEIEKLLAANKHSAHELQIEDNSNEPSALVNHQQQPAPFPRQQPRPKGVFISSTTPNTLVDANNQPFIPSLFQFSNYQQPKPIYPTQAPPKLGPVVYPTAAPASQPAQPSQYYYQEAQPTPSSRPFRAKQYGVKIATPSPSLKAARDKEAAKLQQRYSQPYENDDFERQPQSQTGPVQFYPSQRDPTDQQHAQQPNPRPTLSAPQRQTEQPASSYRQFVLPSAAPSQSSIYVSQGTGITTPSRPVHKQATKTAEDVRQLRLPQPGGKPLTQAEFQALIDAGYPVTAVPVPVPVPYEQYVKENPDYRNQPVDYPIMRLAQQYATSPSHHARHPHHHHQQRALAAPSEHAVQIVSSPSESKTATAIGGGGITYLRPIAEGVQQRRPRDEKDSTAVEGKKKA